MENNVPETAATIAPTDIWPLVVTESVLLIIVLVVLPAYVI